MSTRNRSQTHGAGLLFVSTVAVLAAIALGLRVSGVLPVAVDSGAFSAALSQPLPWQVTAFQARPAETGATHVLPAGDDGLVRVPELKEATTRLNDPTTTIEDDFETIGMLLDYYRRANSGTGPPGGENEEIVAQLRGQNAKHLAVLVPDHPAINAKGQLADRWGTPFHFHPVSRDNLEIRSAGPDRKLFTTDDVVH